MGRLRSTILLAALGVAGFGLYRRRRALIAQASGLPPAQHAVTVQRDLAVPMPDEVNLVADLYSPTSEGSFPTILIRTPYGRAGDLGVFGWFQDLIARLFAERGYHVLLQSTRGRFRSEGRFTPFVDEARDGRATLEWIATQPWFNGYLGMWGPSYLGYVQWAVAADAPPFLKALVPIVTSARFSRLFYQNGAFALDGAVRWSYLVHVMEGEQRRFDLKAARGAMLARAPGGLTGALNHLPVSEAARLALGHEVPFYNQWLDNPGARTPFWQTVDHPGGPVTTGAAVHLIAGWYDIFLGQQLADYAAMLAAGRTPYLTVGPWHHYSNGFFGESLREGLAWFDAQLKGEADRLRRRSVRLYVMEAHEWHEMDFWPPPATLTRYFLQPGQVLATQAPPFDVAPDHYSYDPANPPPSIGGPLLNLGAGPRDQHALEARPDVLVYTSAPLEVNTDVIGYVRLELFVRSSLEYTDFVARLCDVEPGGRSINVCDGLFRVTPGAGEPQPDGSLRIEIDLWATARRFRRGHAVRLQITSAAHPRWARNPGHAGPAGAGSSMRVAKQTIYHDAGHPSALVLPVVRNQ